jgi:hypothetical protein
MKRNQSMKNRNVIFTTILLTLFCVALLPKVQAVVPAPDGGYPGGNTAEGQTALLSLTSGGFNTAVGYLSLGSDTTGSFNTAVGAGALLVNTGGNNTGDRNTATGVGTLLSNTIGDSNAANGAFALSNNTTGNANTAIGSGALENNTTGGFNTALGNIAGAAVTTASNVICIGAYGANVDNSCYIGGIFGQAVDPMSASPVLIDGHAKLGTISSSRRFKQGIKPMDKASEAILTLKPVTFHYKSDAKNTPCFGLIAEEVAEVNPDLVVRDKDGEIYTVRYDAVNAMLLNEFLKEHRKVQQQEATITRLTKDFQATAGHQQQQIESLTAGLQRVRTQLELSKPAPNVACLPTVARQLPDEDANHP